MNLEKIKVLTELLKVIEIDGRITGSNKSTKIGVDVINIIAEELSIQTPKPSLNTKS